MENNCLKLGTPSEAVLYFLKTFAFQMKSPQKTVDVLETKTLDNFCSFWIIPPSHVTKDCDAVKSARSFSPSSLRTANLPLFCSHNPGFLLKIWLFSLVRWKFCIKVSEYPFKQNRTMLKNKTVLLYIYFYNIPLNVLRPTFFIIYV